MLAFSSNFCFSGGKNLSMFALFFSLAPILHFLHNFGIFNHKNGTLLSAEMLTHFHIKLT